jgi:hypothetical protein
MSRVKFTFLGLIDDQLRYSVQIGDCFFKYSTGLGWLQTKREPGVKPFDLGPANSEIRAKVAKALKPFGRLTVNDVEYLNVYRREPSERDFLDCIYSDADAGNMLFKEFCSNFGYSDDSIKALDIYRECQDAAEKAQKLEREGLIKRPIDENEVNDEQTK